MAARKIAILVAGLAVAVSPRLPADPPFGGTIFIDPDIITESDPTAFDSVSYAGQGMRTMFDRRSGWVDLNAYLFEVRFEPGMVVEFQVNPEFGSVENARDQVEFYAPVIGRLPRSLRRDVETSWIHMGDEPFGGGNKNLLIHTGSIAQGYIESGILEETFVHEAAHTSLDADHAAAQGWLDAQAADPEFISEYARDFPDREDIAESVLPWLAVRYRQDRISDVLEDQILAAIPNRLAYFDGIGLNMLPVTDTSFAINAGINDAWVNADAAFQGIFLTVFPVLELMFAAWFTFDSVPPPDVPVAVFGARDHRWVTALGAIEGNRASLTAELTSGGIFNASDPLADQVPGYGMINIDFTDCENGFVEYHFPAAEESGGFAISRVLPDNAALCEALAE